MTTFKDREKGFELKFAHDAEMLFKAEARRNRKLAQWIAEKIGMSSEEAASYAGKLIAADLKEAGDDDVVGQIVADCAARNVTVDPAEVKRKSAEFLAQAKVELFEEDKTS